MSLRRLQHKFHSSIRDRDFQGITSVVDGYDFLRVYEATTAVYNRVITQFANATVVLLWFSKRY